MPCDWAESFDDGNWVKNLGSHALGGGTQVSTSYGKNGNGARVGDDTATYFYCPVPGHTNKWQTFGFHFRMQSTIGAYMAYFGPSTYIMLKFDSANSRLLLDVQTSSTGHAIISTDIGSVTTGVWHYVEVELYSNTGSAGYSKLWLDGELHDEAGPFDYFGHHSIFRIGGTTSSDNNAFDVDDVVYVDSGGEEPNGPMGPVNLFEIFPDGNGNTSQLVGQDADSTNNYLNVDEATPDDGTTYNGSATDDDYDSYSMDDVPGTPENIPAMIVKLNAAKTDVGAKFMKAVIRAKTLVDYTTTPTLTASTTDTTFAAANAWRVTASFWKSTAVAATEWWKADFGSAKTFGKVLIDITAGGSTYPTVMDLEYSDDDSAWESAGAQLTGVTAGSHEFKVDEPVAHRYWRIVFSSFSGANGMEADNIYFHEVSATLADVDGPGQALAESYSILSQPYGRNPGTNQKLTYADINAMEIGAKVSDTT